MDFFNYYVDHTVDKGAQRDAQRALNEAERAESRARDAEKRLHQLGLVTAAVWSFVRDQQGLTDDDLHARVGEIAEAQAAAGPGSRCVPCGRPIQKNRTECIYCGERVPAVPI